MPKSDFLASKDLWDFEGGLKYLGFSSAEGEAQVLPYDGNVNTAPPFLFHRDPIFVAVRMVSTASLNGGLMISEMGFSKFDVRDLSVRFGPGNAHVQRPGDRGHVWSFFIKSTHFVTEKFYGQEEEAASETRAVKLEDEMTLNGGSPLIHGSHNTGSHHSRDTSATEEAPDTMGSFGFGTSTINSLENVLSRVRSWLGSLKRLNLCEGERQRFVIMISFDKVLELAEFSSAGLNLAKHCDHIWDVTRMYFANVAQKAISTSKLTLEDLVLLLGINIDYNILYNAGNFARTVMEVFLAGALLDAQQQTQLANCVALSPLPARWTVAQIKNNRQAVASHQDRDTLALLGRVRALGYTFQSRKV